MGGGILPIALHNNEVYLLFGKENELDDTQGWADFGGGRNKNETVFQTAVREGCEELNGFLGSVEKIREDYEKNKIGKVTHEKYGTYMYEVDYDSKMPSYFRGNYLFLSSRLPNIKGNTKNGLLEKSQIKWFTFAELRRDKSKFRSFYQAIVEKILAREEEIREKVGVKKEEEKRKLPAQRPLGLRRTRKQRK